MELNGRYIIYHAKIFIWKNLLVLIIGTAKHHAYQQGASAQLQFTKTQIAGFPNLASLNTKLQYE